MVAFTISIIVILKHIKLDLSFTKFILKPILATAIMAVCSYFAYLQLASIISMRMATIIAIVIAVIVYIIAVIALKIFTKEELYMIPYGTKFVKILEKLKIY